ncbi:MAG: hypothetical protein IPI77_19350 [Saprospiraceae bacterium]|nr:hypothetical protein [Saprospiraceae bacterium]
MFNEDITLFLHHPSVVNWEFANYWKTTFITGEGTIKHLIPNFLFVFSPIAHPGYLFPGLILIYICIKEKALVGLHWAAWVLGYLCYAFFFGRVSKSELSASFDSLSNRAIDRLLRI